jgi:hypothetical protein
VNYHEAQDFAVFSPSFYKSGKDTSMSQSEVARIREQMVAEYEAGKRGLEGLAVTARHQFITQKVENMSHCHTRLIALVGQEQAGKIIAEVGL